MNELSRIDADEREEREAKRHEKLRQKQRFEAALAFTIAACDSSGMVSDDDIRVAVLQTDRLLTQLEK